MKSSFMSKALAVTKTSEPSWVLSSWSIWTSCGLKIAAAPCNSGSHSSFPLLASSDGTQPNGPVPVTNTLRAPNSNSLCKQLDSKICDGHSRKLLMYIEPTMSQHIDFAIWHIEGWYNTDSCTNWRFLTIDVYMSQCINGQISLIRVRANTNKIHKF